MTKPPILTANRRSARPYEPDALVADRERMIPAIDAQSEAQIALKAAEHAVEQDLAKIAALRADETTDPAGLGKLLAEAEATLDVDMRRYDMAAKFARSAAETVKIAEREAFASPEIAALRREYLTADSTPALDDLDRRLRELIADYASRRRLVNRSVIAAEQVKNREPISRWSGGHVPVNVESDVDVWLKTIIERLGRYRHAGVVAKAIVEGDDYPAADFPREIRTEIAGKLPVDVRRTWLAGENAGAQ